MGPRLHLGEPRPALSAAPAPWWRSMCSTSLCGQPTPTEARHAHHHLRPDATAKSRHRATERRRHSAAPRARDGALDRHRPLVARRTRIRVAVGARMTSVAARAAVLREGCNADPAADTAWVPWRAGTRR